MERKDFQHEAQRLEKLTKLVPIWFTCDVDWKTVQEIAVHPEPNPVYSWGRIVGVRMFHAPRQVVVERVRISTPYQIDGTPRFADVSIGPFDAAAYAVENPLPPLRANPDGHPLENYRGDPMRFVAVDWGWTSSVAPLLFEARAYGTPSVPFPFEGVVIVEPWSSTGDPWDLAPWDLGKSRP